MNFRRGHKGRKSKHASLGHGKPGRVTSLTPKRGRPVRTKGRTGSM